VQVTTRLSPATLFILGIIPVTDIRFRCQVYNQTIQRSFAAKTVPVRSDNLVGVERKSAGLKRVVVRIAEGIQSEVLDILSLQSLSVAA
jgi:hypothetical protein